MTCSNRTTEQKLSAFLLMAGAILLANPVWGVTDILPDLLAWGMIWFGLRSFSEQNGEMFLARKQALYLMAIQLGKTLLWSPLQASEIPSDTMLAVTVATAGEIWCGMLFFSRLFRGVDEFARDAGNDALYLKTENVKFLSNLFLWVRGLATLLPQLTAIPDWMVQYGEIIDDDLYDLCVELAASESLLNLVFSVFVIIAAVVWLVSYLPYLKGFFDCSALEGVFAHSAVAEDPIRLLKRRFSHLHMARICFALGLVFLLDLHVDGFRFMPVCAFPAFFALGCLFMDGFAREKRFRKTALLFGIGAFWFLLSELYRRFCTVWDLRAFGEVEIGVQLLSSGIMLAGMCGLFYAWLSFADEVDALSASVRCGKVYLGGFTYWIFLLYAAVQTVIYVLPLAVRELNSARVVLVVLLWIFTNRRLAAFEENAKKQMMLYVKEDEEE